MSGQDAVDRPAHREEPAGRQLACTATRRLENRGWSKALFAQVVCTPSERKLSWFPMVQTQLQVYLTRGVVNKKRTDARRYSSRE